MYTMMPMHEWDTPGRVATLLMVWHTAGERRAHFFTAEDPDDHRLWLIVSTAEPVPHVSHDPHGRATLGSVLSIGAFLYPDDLEHQSDSDVRAKIARLYSSIPVGSRVTVDLGPRHGRTPSALPGRVSPVPIGV